MARITLYGMIQYNPNLFRNIVLPEGIEHNLLVNEIISKSGDLFPYYQVPDILKQNIDYWFLRRKYDFEMMYKALHADYNPIENYNRYEALDRDYRSGGSDSTNRKYENTGNSTDTTTLGSSTTLEHGLQTATDSAENISAFNSSDYVPRSKEIGTTKNSGKDITSSSGSDKNENNTKSTSKDISSITYGSTRDENENNHIHGNIGVTTNQQMIEAEEEMRKKYDLYKMIAELFEREFIVQLY